MKIGRKQIWLIAVVCYIGIAVMLVLSIMFFIQIAQKPEAKPSPLSVNITNEIRIDNQDYIDSYINWKFDEVNDKLWAASFTFKEPFWSDVKKDISNPSDTAAWQKLKDVYLPTYNLGKIRTDLLNLSNYPLVNLTSNIEFSDFNIDLDKGNGSFNIIFPQGFKENEKAKFGFGTTNISSGTVSPFPNPNQRSLCRDASGVLHATWLSSASNVRYGNSSDNGLTWNVNMTFINGTAGNTRQPTHISCNGNNITVGYEDSTKDWLMIAISTNNGANWTWQDPVNSSVGIDVVVERKGMNIYVVYRNATSAPLALKFINSSDGGATWGPIREITPAFSEFPSMVVDGTGTSTDKIYIAYQNSSDTSIYFINSTDSGATWGPVGPPRKKIISGAYTYPSIAFNGTNIYVVAYTSSAISFTNSTDSGATWTTAYAPYNPSGNEVEAELSLTSQGYPALFISSTQYDANYDIAYGKSNGTAWENLVYATNDSYTNRYANAIYNFTNNRIEFLFQRGAAGSSNIIYDYVGFDGSPHIFGFPDVVQQTIYKSTAPLNCSAVYGGANNGRVEFIWFVNGTLQSNYNGSTAANVANMTRVFTNVSLSNTTFWKAGIITCAARAYNGSVYSPWLNSSTVTVANTAPTIAGQQAYINWTAGGFNVTAKVYDADGLGDISFCSLMHNRSVSEFYHISEQNITGIYDSTTGNCTTNISTSNDNQFYWGRSIAGSTTLYHILINDTNSLYDVANTNSLRNYFKNGTLNWTVNIVNNVHGLSQDSNYIYAGDSADNLHKRFKLNGSNASSFKYGSATIYTTAVDDSWVYWGDSAYNISKVNKTNFTQLNWSVDFGAGNVYEIAIDSDYLYAADDQGNITKMFLLNGTKVWSNKTYPTGAKYSIAVDGDYLWVGDANLVLWQLNKTNMTGITVVNSTDYGTGSIVDIVYDSNYVYFTDQSGNIRKVDKTTKAVQWTLTQGTLGMGLAIDDYLYGHTRDGSNNYLFKISKSNATNYTVNELVSTKIRFTDKSLITVDTNVGSDVIPGTSGNQPPTWSNNQTNNTNTGWPTLFSLNWTSSAGLSGYIFSIDNCTGTFSNDTWVAMAGTVNWSNATDTINSTVGCTIRWRVYANNSANLWNASDIFTFPTTQLVTVCKSGGCNSNTVQGGINLVSNGWIVKIIDSSWYNENVVLNRSITLTSNSSVDPTINSTGTTLKITVDSTTVSNLTLAYNGTTSNQNTVWITGDYATVANNTITMTSQYGNYPVYIQNSANNTIYGNNITAQSWCNDGIYLSGSASTNNTINSNNVTYDATCGRGIEIEANNNTIINNNITNTGGNLPIYMTPYLDTVVINNNNYNGKPIVYNNSIQNLTITATTYGELILGNSFNVTINSSSFTEGGILFLRTTNSTISNSNITVKPSAIVFDDSSNYNTIFNNNISTSGGDRTYGLTLYGNYFNITKNNITITGDGYNFAIYGSPWYSTISSNVIKTTGWGDVGILLSGSYNAITNNNITTTAVKARGIWLEWGNYNNITSCNITTTGAGTGQVDHDDIQDYIPAALHITGGNQNIISNCILNSTNYYDIFVSDNNPTDVNYLINTTFNKTDIYFNSSTSSQLYNQYTLDAYVNNTFGNPINSANVLILDNRSSFLNTSGLTGSWKFEEGSGSTTADSSGNGNNGTINGMKIVTSNGGASIDTSQSEFGGASGKFVAANTQYLSIADSADWTFGTGDLTVEAWVRFNSLPSSTTYANIMGQRQNSSEYWEWRLYNTGTYYQWQFRGVTGGSTTVLINAQSNGLLTNTWYHVAFVRSSGTWYFFENGSSLTLTSSTDSTLADNTGSLTIGNVADRYLDGWLDEVRISKYIARWTSNFSPPTSPYTADSSTVLLLHMNGSNGSTNFLDDSMWATGKYGSALNFNGAYGVSSSSVPYVSLPASNTLNSFNTTNQLTVAAWVYPIYNSCDLPIAATQSNTVSGFTFVLNSLVPKFYSNRTSTAASFSVPLNQWSQVVATYNNGNVAVYINGVQAGSSTGNPPINTTSNLVISLDSYGFCPSYDYTFNGTIDEVQIWNRSLSDTEIRGLYETISGNGIQTNSSGYIQQQLLNEFLANYSYNSTNGYLYYTNYTVNASATGFVSSSQQLNLTSNSLLIFTLNTSADNQPPRWSNNQTSIVSTYSPTTLSQFNITWTDNGAVSQSVFESNFSGIPTNYTIANGAFTFGNGIWSYNNTLPAGTFYWKSYANDTSNNWNVSDTWYFAINKTQPVLILSNNTATVNSSGLVGYWRFENESLGTATDYSGWNNSGTLTNMNNTGNSSSGPTVGSFGKAMQFDGVNDYVSIPDSPNWYFGTGDFTIDFWVRFNSPLVSQQGFVSQQNGNDIFEFYYSFSHIYFIDRFNSVILANYNLAIVPSTLVWTHIALVRNSSDIYMFINGVSQTLAVTTAIGSNNLGDIAGPLKIGWESNNNVFLNGSLDEFHVWKNRSLTADEINELYQSQVTYGTQTNFSFSDPNTGDSDVNYDFFRNGTVAGVWHFDEGSGNTTVDSSGNGNYGTLTNMNTTGNATSGWTANGKYGNGLLFDSVNDYVDAGNNPSLNITGALTIGAWIYPLNAAGGTQQGIVIKGQLSTPPYNHYAIWLVSNQIVFSISNDTTNPVIPTPSIIQNNQWQHIVATWDGTMNPGGMNIYVNGVLKATGQSTISSMVGADNEGLAIGADGHGGSPSRKYFNGTIDEVRIYPRALSPAEILCQYGNNCTQAGFNNETNVLPAGLSYYSARASGGQNYTQSNLLLPLNVTQANANVQMSPSTQNIIYGTSVSQYCSSSGIACKLYVNNFDNTTLNNTNIQWGAGTYNYVANVSDTVNYTNAQASSTVTVNKGILLGSISGSSVTYPTTVNIIPSESNSGDSDINYTFWRNNTLISSSMQGNPSADTSQLGAGTYIYRLNSTGGANWTSNSSISSLTITVSQNTTNPIDIYFINSTGTYKNQNMTLSAGQQTTANATMIYSNAGAVNLYQDNSLISNPNTTTLSAGVHSFTGNTTGNQNYTANSTTYYITVGDFAPPIWQNQGTNDTDNIIQQGQGINLTAQGKDETALDWSWLSTNESGTWQNKTTYNSPKNMAKNSNWQWSNFTWSNSSITRQTIGWRIYYNDTSGNQNVTDIQTFAVGDMSAPQWQNQGTNDTDNIIQQGQGINLTAQGKDETALDWAWLSTNENGVWQNKTTYNSPMNMAKNSNWQWSNFTWQNSSVLIGTTIGWRIYYNDTSGNQNVTDIQTFSIPTTGNFVNMSLNTTQVWWQDVVNASGYANASVSVTVYADSTQVCSTVSSTNGLWSCTFAAPTGIGTYSIAAKIGTLASSQIINLKLSPSFGVQGIGSTPRVVYEVPFLIQDINGNIQKVFVRVAISK